MSSQSSTRDQYREKASNAVQAVADTVSPQEKQSGSDPDKDANNFDKDSHGNVFKKGDFKDQLNQAACEESQDKEASYVEKALSYIPGVASLQQSVLGQKSSNGNESEFAGSQGPPYRPKHDAQVEAFLRDQYQSNTGTKMPKLEDRNK